VDQTTGAVTKPADQPCYYEDDCYDVQDISHVDFSGYMAIVVPPSLKKTGNSLSGLKNAVPALHSLPVTCHPPFVFIHVIRAWPSPLRLISPDFYQLLRTSHLAAFLMVLPLMALSLMDLHRFFSLANCRNLFFLLSLTVTSFAFAQESDPKARAILDDLSKTTKSYRTIQADVLFTVMDKDKRPAEKQSWKLFVKGDRFKLEIPGSTIVCDGKTLWNYNKDAKEVTIIYFDPEKDEQKNTKIFTMY
jgi:hypothetical protein